MRLLPTIVIFVLLPAGMACGRISFDRRPVSAGDAGPSDAAAPRRDGGTDSGAPGDSGVDGGVDAGGSMDAGAPDAGTDSGRPGCEAAALAPLLTSLHAYWPFDGTGQDASGVNVDLNLIGDATYGASLAPTLGSALELDGDGDGAVAPGFVKVATEYTVVAWANAREVSGFFPSIVKNWSQNQRGQLHVGLDSTRLSNYTSVQPSGQERVGAPTDFPVDEWVHVAAVLDATAQEHRLYVNGVRVDDMPHPDPLSLTGAVGIGVGLKPSNDGTGPTPTADVGYWNGFIDDVAVFDTPASDAEILLIYQQGLNGHPLVCE